MKYRMLLGAWMLFCAALCASAQQADTAKLDWPQWRGPNRDGISSETGLLKTWPEGGPKVVWTSPIGDGYSAVAITKGRIFTMDSKGTDEYVVCLDQASGKEIWRTKTD